MRNRISNCSVDTSGEKHRAEKKTQSVGYMLHTSSDAATTCSDHVRKNAWERISVAVGDIGCGWLLTVVEEPWGVVVGVEGAM
eukprot:scaffold19927_cov28-Attheya_sp.AAC.1